jgi:hypothetical protein
MSALCGGEKHTSDLMIRVHKMQYPTEATCLDTLPDCSSAALEDTFEIISEMIFRHHQPDVMNPPRGSDSLQFQHP